MAPKLTRAKIVQAVVVAVLVISPLLIGAGTAQERGNTQDVVQFTTIDALLAERPVGRHVTVTGTVTISPENYTAESGNTYQEFRISDGTGDIKVFCNTRDGRVSVDQGEDVTVKGTFKEFYGTPEIYAACAAVGD